VILALLALRASAQDEHSLAAPAPVVIGATRIPDGPPRTVTAAPGDDLAATVAGLPAGSTLRLGPGRYAGPLTLDRPLTLEGGGATLVGQGRGTVLTLAAPDVTVRDLSVTGGGHDPTTGDAGVLVGADRFHLERLVLADVLIGIDVRMANDGAITGCTLTGPADAPIGVRGDGIRLWESDRNRVVGNHLEHVRDLVVWYSENNTIADNSIHRSRYGVHFMHASGNTVTGNQFLDDVVGAFVMYSDGITLADNVVSGANGAAGMGFGFKESDLLVVRDNRLLGSTTGLYLDTTPNRIGGSAAFTGNLLAHDHTGLRLHGVRAGAVFTDNELHENAVQVAVDGGGEAPEVRFAGNRWSDYTGYDLDGDGFGDLPYAPRRFSRGLFDRRPVAAFFDGTPAAGLLDFLGEAFPMWAPPPLVHDDHPRLGGGLLP
jgi:nitrous oxidase accessory protein